MASSSLVSLPCLSSQKMTFKPMATLSNPPRTTIPYELKKGQNRLFHKLPSCLKMEGESDEPLGTVAGTLQERQMHFQNFQGLYLFARCHLRVIGKRLTTYWLMLISENFFFVKLIYNIRGLSFLFSGLVLRYLFSKPVAAFKVTLSLAAKRFQTSIPLCRETFFSSAMDDQLVQRYQDLMKESSRTPLFDLKKLNASLPVPKPTENSTKVLVV